MKGYKGFDSKWTCKGFQYKVGETYEMDGEISLCERGFHFCKNLEDVFKYYPSGLYAEVEALGDIVEDTDSTDSKCVTNKIKIVKQFTQQEVCDATCHGKNNTGIFNFGDDNKGSRNYGHENTGDANFGNRNLGSFNRGDDNSGRFNHGSANFGDRNYGYNNNGDYNYGHRNYGDNNHGSDNFGTLNFGDNNIGSENYGNMNTGLYNYGFGNSGNCCHGDFNSCDGVVGCFNTINLNSGTQFFNRPVAYLIVEWFNSNVRQIVCGMPADKANRTDWWESLEDYKKEQIQKILNFNLKMFCDIVGINLANSGWEESWKEFNSKFAPIEGSKMAPISMGRAWYYFYKNRSNENEEVNCLINFSENSCTFSAKDGTGFAQLPITEIADNEKLIALAYQDYKEKQEKKE